MTIDWAPGYGLLYPKAPKGPLNYIAERGDFSLLVAPMSEDPDDRWVWVIDKLDDDRHPECVAIGIEWTASDALQEAERALHLREHGVTPDVTEYRRAT